MLLESSTQLFADLQQPASPQTQASALRRLKNQIIGHPQKKEIWVQRGILDVLGRILTAFHRSLTYDTSQTSDGFARNGDSGETRRLREDVVLQAIIVIGSLAQGGPRFIAPMTATQILPVLTSMLNPAACSPQIVLNVLRVLNAVADSVSLQNWQTRLSSDWPLRSLYNNQILSNLARILEQPDSSPVTQQQMALAGALIGKTCHEEEFRKRLAASGLLEALATRLIPFMMDSDGSVPAARPHYSVPQSTVSLSSTRTRLAPFLHAIASIVRNSSSRSTRFLSAPAFHVFQSSTVSDWWRTSHYKARNPQTGHYGDAILPPPHDSVTSARRFPPLGGLAIWGKSTSSATRALANDGHGSSFNSQGTHNESPVGGWLAYVVQAEYGVTRLVAAWLLAILFKDGLTSKEREKALSMQLIPLIARMLESDSAAPAEIQPSWDDAFDQSPQLLIKRLAPHVLALLVGESKQLQLAASEAGVIKKLSLLLKQTFDNLPEEKTGTLWSPDGATRQNSAGVDASSSSSLGPWGITLATRQVLQTREAVLEALASMATEEDELRKAIINNGVVQYIVASLSPDPSNASVDKDDSTKRPGNPIPVLMQACAAATALSRSVSTLRTSLIDAGLAKPIFALLKHPDIQVQIAATGATCNIVLEFSPMRQEMIGAGVLEVLCKRAHSPSLSLRLNSLWALKHLVHAAPNSLRQDCLETLGVEWLKQLICNEAESSPKSPSLAMGTPNAAGERVDLLNTDDMASATHGLHATEADDEVLMVDAAGSYDRSNKRETTSRNITIQAQENEADQALKHHRDTVFVQAQALDLVRNLISGPGSAEMVDHIFQELGQQTLFDIFTNLLRHRPADHVYGRAQRRAGSATGGASGVRHVSPQSEVVAGVIHILVHLAGGGLPRHRQLLLAQTELMELVVQLSQHQDPEVRSAYAWLGINLTWLDDSSDKLNVRSRIHELRKLGMVERLESLQQDPNLDVRERARTAVHQIHEVNS